MGEKEHNSFPLNFRCVWEQIQTLKMVGKTLHLSKRTPLNQKSEVHLVLPGPWCAFVRLLCRITVNVRDNKSFRNQTNLWEITHHTSIMCFLFYFNQITQQMLENIIKCISVSILGKQECKAKAMFMLDNHVDQFQGERCETAIEKRE